MTYLYTLLTLALTVAPWTMVQATPLYRPCNVQSVAQQLSGLPAGLAQPTATPAYVGIGVGFQNYTCTNGTYKSRGAVAQLFDISCFYSTGSSFTNLPDTFLNAWEAAPSSQLVPSTALSNLGAGTIYPPLANHYFIANADGSISPKWDATSVGWTAGNSNAFVVGQVVGNVASPDSTQDVNWLDLNGISGQFATQIYRVNTRQGQPPSQCAASDPQSISVKYVANYYFYGGSFLPN